MLALAIKARIPIIRARTTDLLNLPDVLKAIAPGMKIEESRSGIQSRADLVYSLNEMAITRSLYEGIADQEKVFLLINQEDPSGYSFDAGEVPVPKALVENLVGAVVPEKKVPELMPCFNGLTLKATMEVIRLTTARDKSLTVRGVTQTRAMLTGKLQGLGQVNVTMPLYLCPPALKVWIDKNKPYFLEAPNPLLVPKGILFDGEPGVGKSQGAKHIANELGVPLYRLDLATSLGKWVGESEKNLLRILNALDEEEPSVLLIDECEKLFSENDDDGVTKRLLSQLLWWMAEHTSRVLTVATTNKKEAIPPELYRAGRIDKVLTIAKPNASEAKVLAVETLKQFVKPTAAHTAALAKGMKNGPKAPSHADIVNLVYDLVKEHRWVV